jgi:anti-sigma28 factor (negative regulator of flagellin synthesis)
MRIDSKVAISPITREAREAQPAAAKADDAAASSAVVKLSAAGAAASAEPGAAASATTTSRLQAIRAMLDRGDYPVDLDVLATRIVDDEVLRVGRS